jgi:hypothetical protein
MRNRGILGLGAIGAIIGLTLVMAAGGWLYQQKRNLEKVTRERDQAIAQRDLTAGERDKAIAVAKENAVTITRLEEEKELVNTALNALSSARESSRASAGTREVIIRGQAAAPSSSARTAPVIGAVIEEVQVDRDRRRPGAGPAPPSGTQPRVLE